MRSPNDAGVNAKPDPRWSRGLLYALAAVCFAPLLSTLALGVIAVPMWTSMLVMKLAQPNHFDPGDSAWHIAFPIVWVVAGVIGTIGLFRTLALLRNDATVRSRKLTSVMVAVGLVGLSLFNVTVFAPFSESDDEEVPWMALTVYVVLPYFASACLLHAARKPLRSAWQVTPSRGPSA
jgi:hypothetical protein